MSDDKNKKTPIQSIEVDTKKATKPKENKDTITSPKTDSISTNVDPVKEAKEKRIKVDQVQKD